MQAVLTVKDDTTHPRRRRLLASVSISALCIVIPIT
jgi:hypothetical protein